MVPFVAGVLIWRDMLNADSGWVNGFLRLIGIAKPPEWLQDPTWIYSGLAMMGIWAIGAGIDRLPGRPQGHPDRAVRRRSDRRSGAWDSLRRITIPLLSPVIFYTLVLAVVEVLQYFLVPLVLKNGTGEPGGTTLFYNLYIYKNFFTFQDMSYGATLAWVLFADLAGGHDPSLP